MCDASFSLSSIGFDERMHTAEATTGRDEATGSAPRSSSSSSRSDRTARSSPGAPPNEAKRLASVFRFHLKDTPKEQTAAAEICQVPAALITVVDADSTWFKSNIGFGDATRTTRNRSLCDQVVRTNEMLIVEDLTKDPRFANNPFVTAKPHMRFYAGAPLIDPESGQAIGSLCVIDFVPRVLNDLQKQALKLLSRQVMSACESRLRIIHLEEALLQLEETRGALKASKEQAERAQKQAEQANLTKSEFLANMSHEIRTPLNGVLGTASLLAETTRLDFEQRDYVRVIQSSGEHLLIVLNDILDFSKFESGKLEIDAGRVDLQSMLEQAIELSFKPKPTLELVYEIGSDVPPTILGDVTRLRQIVANLISNASKFCTRGEVSVKVQRMTPEEIAAHQGPPLHQVIDALASPSPSPSEMSDALAAVGGVDPESTPVHHHYNSIHHSPAGVAASSMHVDGPTVVTANVAAIRSPLGQAGRDATLASDSLMLVFSVSDTGIGIAPSKIHKLFSAFTQLDISITREYGGTGLGLAISARLAQLMGGTMWVKSEVGKGSTFFFSIRTRPQPSAAPSHPSAPPSPSHSAQPSSSSMIVPHPLAAEFPAWSEIHTHAKVAAHHEGRMHVMVVEPNSHLLLSLVVQLRKWGFTPLPYSSCIAAKEALQEQCVIDHQLVAIIMTQTFSSPASATRSLSADAAAPSSASNEEPYLLVDAIRALDRVRADGTYATSSNLATNSMADDAIVAASAVTTGAGSGASTGNISPTSAACLAGDASATGDSTAVICPDEYVIPCIILLPTELEDEPSAAATIAAARTAFVRARRCNPLHKPVLFSKLARKLDKVFRFALYGEDPYPNTSGVVPGSIPTPTNNQRSLFLTSSRDFGPNTPDLPPIVPNSIPHSTPMRSRALAQHIPNSMATAGATSVSAGSSPLQGPVSRLFSASNPLRILVVEDNSVNMRLVVKMLRTLGYNDVTQAWNGQEAVDAIVRDGGQFDLVLMDNAMPLLTGPQACKQIVAHFAERPKLTPPVIIALTAACMESDKLEAKLSGHSDFLSKPLSLPTLKAKLQHWAKIIQNRAASSGSDTSSIRSGGYASGTSSTVTSPVSNSAASVASMSTEMES